jgi:hypothetical protein
MATKLVSVQARPTKGVPTFFRALCSTTSRGGSSSYHHVGREFMHVVRGEIPFSVECTVWDRDCDQLDELVGANDSTAVLAWCDLHFPMWMELIPKQHRDKFVDGVFDAAKV